MKELLNQLALKNGRKKSNSKLKNKLMAADKKDAEALLAKLALDAKKEHVHKRRDPSVGAGESENVEFENDVKNNTSTEEYENILKKLKLMGPKGKRVLELLRQSTLSTETDDVAGTTPTSTTTLPTSVTSPLEVEVKETESAEQKLVRQKREFVLKTAMKHKELNVDEEESANLAIEEVKTKYLCEQCIYIILI